MKNSEKRIGKGIFAFILFLFMLFTIAPRQAEAAFGIGEGDKPTEQELGYWFNAAGTGAYNYFVSKNVPMPKDAPHYSLFVESRKTATLFATSINKLGSGFKNGSTTETLAVSCSKSDYIWWYGEWPYGYMFTQTNGSNKIPEGNWQSMNERTRGVFNDYKAWSKKNGNAWEKGQVVLICSGAFMRPKPVPANITVAAKSGTFKYDGKDRTVSGYDLTAGKLKSGHKLEVTATRTEKNVGGYQVKVSKVNILNGSNKNVNTEYNIKTVDGSLVIYDGGIGSSTADGYQCISVKTDTASAYTLNTVRGSHGYTPDGAPTLKTLESTLTTGAEAIKSTAPKTNGTEASWNTWKTKYQGASSTSTKDINLDGAGSNVSQVLGQYGGVYNVSRRLRKDTYTMKSCQPQTRTKVEKEGTKTVPIVTKDANGKETKTNKKVTYKYLEWGPWTNKGGRTITSISAATTYEDSTYQILSVNCNIPGFNSVKDSIAGETVRALSDGRGAYLKTANQSGTAFGDLGKTTHATGKSAFYTDGPSCDFTCVVDKQPTTASSDAKNNRSEALDKFNFIEILKDSQVGYPNTDGQLVFFRDNEDREIRADVWYPKATGRQDITVEQKAKNTIAKVYNNPNPTPEIELTTIMPSSSKSALDKITSINSEKKYPGEINKFNIKSQWASDTNKPYRIGLNWIYQGTGNSKVPSKLNGTSIVEDKTNTYKFDVICDFKNSGGSFVANSPQAPFVGTAQAIGKVSPKWDANQAIRALFTRSVSDTN